MSKTVGKENENKDRGRGNKLPNKTNESAKQDTTGERGWRFWAPIVVLIIAILLMVYFIFFFNKTENEGQGEEGSETGATVIENPNPDVPVTVDSSGSPVTTTTSATTVPGLDTQPPYPSELMRPDLHLPSTEPLVNPAPTEDRSGGGEGTGPAERNGSSRERAKHVVSRMFAMPVSADNSYRKAFEKIANEEGTDHAKSLEFRQWWEGGEDDHSLAWDVYSNDTEPSTLSTYILEEKQKQIQDNIVQVDMTVGQTIMKGKDYLRQPNFEMRVYMKYDKKQDAWLFHDYSFPNSEKVPTFY